MNAQRSEQIGSGAPFLRFQELEPELRRRLPSSVAKRRLQICRPSDLVMQTTYAMAGLLQQDDPRQQKGNDVPFFLVQDTKKFQVDSSARFIDPKLLMQALQYNAPLFDRYTDLMARFVTANPAEQLKLSEQLFELYQQAGMGLFISTGKDSASLLRPIAGPDLRLVDVTYPEFTQPSRSPDLKTLARRHRWERAAVIVADVALVAMALLGCAPPPSSQAAPLVPTVAPPPPTGAPIATLAPPPPPSPTLAATMPITTEIGVSNPPTLTKELLTTIDGIGGESGITNDSARLYNVSQTFADRTATHYTSAFMASGAYMVDQQTSPTTMADGVKSAFSFNSDLAGINALKVTLPPDAFNQSNALGNGGFPIHTVIEASNTYTLTDTIPPEAAIYVQAQIGDYFLISHTKAGHPDQLAMTLVSRNTITQLLNISGQGKFGFDPSKDAFFLQNGEYKLFVEVPKLVDPNALDQLSRDLAALQSPAISVSPTPPATPTVEKPTAVPTLTPEELQQKAHQISIDMTTGQWASIPQNVDAGRREIIRAGIEKALIVYPYGITGEQLNQFVLKQTGKDFRKYINDTYGKYGIDYDEVIKALSVNKPEDLFAGLTIDPNFSYGPSASWSLEKETIFLAPGDLNGSNYPLFISLLKEAIANKASDYATSVRWERINAAQAAGKPIPSMSKLIGGYTQVSFGESISFAIEAVADPDDSGTFLDYAFSGGYHLSTK